MDREEVLGKIKNILAQMLEIPLEEIGEKNYLVRDLHVESIDLLELAVAINATFGVEVDEDRAFLKELRLVVKEAGEKRKQTMIKERYAHLSLDRIDEILGDMDKGPVLQVRDVVDYILWCRRNR